MNSSKLEGDFACPNEEDWPIPQTATVAKASTLDLLEGSWLVSLTWHESSLLR